jgi:hypothetical protein
VAPEAGLSCCQHHPGGWHSSRSGAGGAAFLSGRSVEGKVTAVTSALSTEDRASGKVSGDPRIECSCDTVGWRGDLAKVASL